MNSTFGITSKMEERIFQPLENLMGMLMTKSFSTQRFIGVLRREWRCVCIVGSASGVFREAERIVATTKSRVVNPEIETRAGTGSRKGGFDTLLRKNPNNLKSSSQDGNGLEETITQGERVVVLLYAMGQKYDLEILDREENSA